MSEIDFDQIKRDVATLATTLFKNFANQGIADGKVFLAHSQAQLITVAQQRARAEITEAEYQDALSDERALAKMVAIKQAGLAQVTIDNFTQGVVSIVTKAAMAAI